MTAPVTVLVADDHPVFRDGLASLLATQDDVEVVATAADGAEAVRSAIELKPDVVVMDLQMPEMNGIEATRRLSTQLPETKILVFTMGEEDGTVLAAMRAGARGYLVKGASQDEVARAITTVHAGELTERELEILDLIAAGRNNAQIAGALYLAPKTVRNNVSNILAKLHATDRADAMIRAREAGLGGS